MKIRNICSIQGTAIENEDALGNIENYFWIIDGATDLYDSKKSIGYSVSEITHLLSEKLKVYCNEKESLKTIFQNAIKEVRNIIGLNDSNHEEYYKLPTFAFIIARLSRRKLEYLILGDCVMLVNDEQLTDHRVDRLFDLGKNEIENSVNYVAESATTEEKKKVEELKNKTRVFHQRLKSTIESQLTIVDSPEWEEILRPTATYLQTSDEAFKEVIEEALGETVVTPEEVDVTRQFSPEELAELQERIEHANRELAATQSFAPLDEEIVKAHQEELFRTESDEEDDSEGSQRIPINIL